MIVTSIGIIGGRIQEKYGKHGSQFSKDGVPTYSLPISIQDAPENTKSFALVLEDKDAIPVCGFSWIHWTAANITRAELKENESQCADFPQGTTSFSSAVQGLDRFETACYGGMTPPDAPHTYELHVYALDCLLNLKQGFYANELYWQMQGHVLATYTLRGIYVN